MKKLYIVVGVLLIVALAISSFGCAKPARAPALKPIKIGHEGPLSGPMASEGVPMLNGIELAFDEVNWEVAGHPIELVVEDDQMDFAIAQSKIKKMILSDKIDLLVGLFVSVMVDVGLMDFYRDNMIVRIFTYAADPEPPGQESKYRFRTTTAGAIQMSPFQAYVAYKEKGYRKAVCFFPDFVEGYGFASGFKNVFEGMGGKVIQELPTPMGCMDFAPYLIKVDVENADFVWAFLFGADAVRFVKQYAEYGLKERLPLFPLGCVVDPAVLEQAGDAALGIESIYDYTPTLDTPENIRFMKAVYDKYEVTGELEYEVGYVAAKVAILGLEAVNGNIEQGNIEQADALVEALEKVSFEAPRGPFNYGFGHWPIENMYLLRVEKVNGELQNVVLKTYPDIEAGWLPSEMR